MIFTRNEAKKNVQRTLLIGQDYSSIGEEAVEANKRDGNYHNRTGRLRNSNYYKVSEHSLQIGNDAPYASEVSNRGYNVIDSGIQLLKKKVEDNL